MNFNIFVVQTIHMYKKLFILFAVILTHVACNKSTPPPATTPVAAKDTTVPIITLTGSLLDSTSLGKAYTDPGATAMDNKDGDLTAFIVYSGAVTTSVVGTYTLGYIVRDSDGNSSVKKIRTIKVKNDADFLVGNYAVTCTCTTMNPGVSTDTVVNTSFSTAIATSSVANNVFNILTFHENYMSFNSTLSGSSLNISYKNAGLSQKNPVNGTGTVSINKSSFGLKTTENFFSYPNMFKVCEAVYVRQ